MKKFLKYSLASICIVAIAMGIYVYTSGYGVEVQQKGVESDIFLKGFENAIGLEADNNGNYFVAYEKEIVKINNENNTEKIYTNTNLDIEDILCIDNNLIILSKGDLLKFDLSNGGIDRILKDIPFGGEHIKRKLLEKDGKVLMSIGTFTNTGVAEKGDMFTKSLCDKTPINIELTGENYGETKTGPFKEYGKSGSYGEKLKGEKLGNGAIYEVDIRKNDIKLYASGLKNIKGIDTNSKNEILCAVQGLEATGNRPALRDSDYIYKVNEGSWYGWPDYSGGDPITSPKFSNENNLKPVMKNNIEKTVLGPYYEHTSLNSIETLAIDKEGVLLEDDTILFFDDIEKKIYSMNDKKVVLEFLELDKKSEIKEILFLDDKCLLLDGESGYIYRLQKNKMNFIGEIPKSIIIIIIGITIILLFIVVKKILKNKK